MVFDDDEESNIQKPGTGKARKPHLLFGIPKSFCVGPGSLLITEEDHSHASFVP